MNDGSVTRWIEQVRQGGESLAEQELWERYFLRLAALARKKLEDLPPHARDDEDVALSALNLFFSRTKRGCYPNVHDRTDLWQLLARITTRKAIDRRRNAQAQKRHSGNRGGKLALEGDRLDDVATNEPTPDMLAAVDEECQLLMGKLDDGLRSVARMKLEGHTNAEIAVELGRVERTVERKLDRIRHIWLQDVESL